MPNNIVIFLQQNLARRHLPTECLNKILEDLIPFNYLSRDLNYLRHRLRNPENTDILTYLEKFVDPEGKIPRVVPIALIQEPVVHNGKITGFPGKLTLLKGSRPRAAIITLPNINIRLNDDKSSDDIACATLFNTGDKLHIASFYQDINRKEIDNHLLMFAKSVNHILIAGDTNAHSTLWGSPDNNPRGDKWEDFLVSTKLSLLNEGEDFTFQNHLGKSHLDITATTLTNKFKNWENTMAQNGSDHNLILFSYNSKPCTIEKYYQNIASADWDAFSEELKDITVPQNGFKTTYELNKFTVMLIDNITEAYNKACPQKRAYPGKPNKWWTREMTVILRKKNIAFKKEMSYSGTVIGERARRQKQGLTRILQNKIRQAKKDSWETFISSQDTPRNIAGQGGLKK